jgi:hypothetical protein
MRLEKVCVRGLTRTSQIPASGVPATAIAFCARRFSKPSVAREQRDRMHAMRAFVAEFNVYRWAGRMPVDAARVRRHEQLSGRLRRAWLEGTLVGR